MFSRFLVFTLILIPALAFSAPKKTICTLTLNSSDEKVAFLKNLAKDQFDFIELTDYEPIYKASLKPGMSRLPWLSAACKAKVSCDALVVSGHFAGSFFGETGLRMTLDEMETLSCNSECDGIFHKPKEVFLFGCNTLAGKSADNRTPEQYRQTLLADGFSTTEAEMMVAFRYSAFGTSFGDQMMTVFAGVPRIYGFNSKAPLGKISGPLVSRYLGRTGSRYSSILDSSTQEKNLALANAFSGTSLLQSHGSKLAALGSSAACFLEGQNSDEVKLKWLSSEVAKSRILEVAGHLLKYLENIRLSGIQLSPNAQGNLESIKRNSQAAKGLLDMLNNQSLPSVQAVLANVARELEWLSDKEYQGWLLRTFFPSGLSSVSNQLYEKVCSYRIQLHLSYDNVSPTILEDGNFINLLGCIRPTDSRFRLAYADLIKKHLQDDQRLGLFLEPLVHLGKAEPELQELIFGIAEDSARFHSLRESALRVIHHSIPNLSEQQLMRLYDLMNDENIKQAVLGNLMRKVPQRGDFLLAVVKATKNNLFYRFAYESLFNSAIAPAAKSQLEIWANTNPDSQLRANSRLALNINEGKPYSIQ